jgi:hypothetical protein
MVIVRYADIIFLLSDSGMTEDQNFLPSGPLLSAKQIYCNKFTLSLIPTVLAFTS